MLRLEWAPPLPFAFLFQSVLILACSLFLPFHADMHHRVGHCKSLNSRLTVFPQSAWKGCFLRVPPPPLFLIRQRMSGIFAASNLAPFSYVFLAPQLSHSEVRFLGLIPLDCFFYTCPTFLSSRRVAHFFCRRLFPASPKLRAF